MPQDKSSNSRATEIRVSRTRGTPPRWSGSETIHFMVPPVYSTHGYAPIASTFSTGQHYLWNDASDGAELRDAHGNMVDMYQY